LDRHTSTSAHRLCRFFSILYVASQSGRGCLARCDVVHKQSGSAIVCHLAGRQNRWLKQRAWASYTRPGRTAHSKNGINSGQTQHYALRAPIRLHLAHWRQVWRLRGRMRPTAVALQPAPASQRSRGGTQVAAAQMPSRVRLAPTAARSPASGVPAQCGTCSMRYTCMLQYLSSSLRHTYTAQLLLFGMHS